MTKNLEQKTEEEKNVPANVPALFFGVGEEHTDTFISVLKAKDKGFKCEFYPSRTIERPTLIVDSNVTLIGEGEIKEYLESYKAGYQYQNLNP